MKITLVFISIAEVQFVSGPRLIPALACPATLDLNFPLSIALAMAFGPARRPAAAVRRHHPGYWCNMRASRLALSRLWTGIGVLMLVAVVVLSLADINQAVTLQGLGKLNHVAAYTALMYWWGMVQPRSRVAWGVGLMILGAGLELAQSMTPYRAMEWTDMAANLVGIALALLLLRTPAHRLLPIIDRKLGNGTDPGVF